MKLDYSDLLIVVNTVNGHREDLDIPKYLVDSVDILEKCKKDGSFNGTMVSARECLINNDIEVSWNGKH